MILNLLSNSIEKQLRKTNFYKFKYINFILPGIFSQLI